MDLEMDPETKAALDEHLAGGEPTTELVTSEGQEVPSPRTIAAPSPTSAGTVAAVTEGGRQQLAPELRVDGRQPSVHSAALVGGNLLKAKEERAAVSLSRVMREAAEKHKVEARGLREELAQAEQKINDLLEKQALAQERMKELEMARSADVKKLMGELDTAVENAAVAQREAQAFEAELGEVRDLLAKTESNRALEAVGRWAANTNVDGADGGGETKKEAGRASSRGRNAEERNPDPLGTRAPSTLESRKLMVQGFVRSTNWNYKGVILAHWTFF
jgi:hypothetical protein